MKKKRILFITSANLATNPRLLKELDAVRDYYEIKVILFKIGNWSDAIDEKLRQERLDVNFQVIDFTKKRFASWIIWALLEKFAQLIYPFFKNCLWLNSLAHGRRGLMLLCLSKDVKRYDAIVCHNLTALYPVYKFHRFYSKPFLFDIEDYEPGMDHTGEIKGYETICETLMKRCVPSARVVNYASPSIGEYSLKLIGGHKQHCYIPNSFYQKEFIPPVIVSAKPLKFVWYSQTISFKRGIEEFFKNVESLIQEMKINKDDISLTLIGRVDPEFEQKQIIQYNSLINIVVIPAMPQNELHQLLSQFHVGLALETSNINNLNYDIALTNKIFGYLQAGLYVLASATKGQVELMKTLPDHGIVFFDFEQQKQYILDLVKNRQKIIDGAMLRYEFSKGISIDLHRDIYHTNILKLY